MADFNRAFDATIQNEGGFVLHETEHDRGGFTFAGISRRHHRTWEGWEMLTQDRDNALIRTAVKNFYFTNFWHIVKGDKIADQRVADSIFDFAVNVGALRAVTITQRIVGATDDGIAGPETLAKLNSQDAELFALRFAIEKVIYYISLVGRLPNQEKFLVGWINRSVKTF